jgi:hypothetical protein
LKADKLAAASDSKRITQNAANEKFLQLLLNLEDSHKAEVDALQARDDAAQRSQQASNELASQERAFERRRLEERQAMAEAQREAEAAREMQTERESRMAALEASSRQQQVQQQMHEMAVSDCITRATARSEYAFNARSNCELNVNWWQQIPDLGRTTTTNCRATMGNSINCTSRTN